MLLPETAHHRRKNREAAASLRAKLGIQRSTALPATVQSALGGAESEPEAILLNRIRWMGLPEPQVQVQLIPHRKFRYDVVWPRYRVAVEVQGGVHSGGRHVRGPAYEQDAIKSGLAQIAGYLCLYVTPGMVKSGIGGFLILEALRSRGYIREHDIGVLNDRRVPMASRLDMTY